MMTFIYTLAAIVIGNVIVSIVTKKSTVNSAIDMMFGVAVFYAVSELL